MSALRTTFLTVSISTFCNKQLLVQVLVKDLLLQSLLGVTTLNSYGRRISALYMADLLELQKQHLLFFWLMQAKINVWNWALKAILYFKKYFFYRKHTKRRHSPSPPQCQETICSRNPLSLIRHSFFLVPHF